MSKLLKDNMDSIDFDDIMTISLLEKRMYYFIGESFDEVDIVNNSNFIEDILFKIGLYNKINIDHPFKRKENWEMEIIPCIRIFFNSKHETIYIFNNKKFKKEMDRTLNLYQENYKENFDSKYFKEIYKEISNVQTYEKLFYYTDQSFREIKEFILRKLSA
jgi:hypothetical protein